MLRVEIFGERAHDPGPNHMANAITSVSMYTPDIMAYSVNPATLAISEAEGRGSRADCFVYVRSDVDQLPFAVDLSNRRDVPLVVMSTNLDIEPLNDLETFGVIASNTPLQVLRSQMNHLNSSYAEVGKVIIEERPLAESNRRDYAMSALSVARFASSAHQRGQQGVVHVLYIAKHLENIIIPEPRVYETEVCVCGENH